MYGLPQSTEIKKQLPKKAIFAKFELKPSQRESFDADIARIDIVAVVSPTTVPAVAEGENIKEFYVLAVQLKHKDYDSKNIAMLSRLIPQKMIMALHFQEEVQFAINHTKLITSDWKSDTPDLSFLTLNGLNLDTVWDNIVISIGDIQMERGNTLTEQIKVEGIRAKLKTQIANLTQKLNKEKQFNRQIEINAEIKALKKQLNNL